MAALTLLMPPLIQKIHRKRSLSTKPRATSGSTLHQTISSAMLTALLALNQHDESFMCLFVFCILKIFNTVWNLLFVLGSYGQETKERGSLLIEPSIAQFLSGRMQLHPKVNDSGRFLVGNKWNWQLARSYANYARNDSFIAGAPPLATGSPFGFSPAVIFSYLFI